MSNKSVFPHLQTAASLLSSNGVLSHAQMRELLCHDCDFWHEGHDDELECSCFKMLRVLIEQGSLTPGGLAQALKNTP